MPDETALEAALQLLATIPEYRWLTSTPDRQWWTVSEVAAQMGVTDDTVRAWAKRGEVPGAVLYTQQVGWRLPRSGLLLYFAESQRRQRGQQSNVG